VSFPPEAAEHKYDAVVIGSGMGGLAAAASLARVGGRRILVLERHFKLGGFTHSFRRGDYRWDPGLHYVGEMDATSQMRRLIDLVTDGDVDWQPLPVRFERYLYPGFEFVVRAGLENFRVDLIETFPGHDGEINRYLRDVSKAAGWYRRRIASSLLPGFLGPMLLRRGRALALTTTADYLRRTITDERLRAVLASQWVDYGLPPAQSPFALHALVVSHLASGGWYPVGGGSQIAAAAERVIASAGGRCVVNANVTEILVDRGRATGVRVMVGQGRHRAESVIKAPCVISDAGAEATYAELLPSGIAVQQRDAVRVALRSPSMVQLFVGLARSPREVGLAGENVWVFDRLDHDAAFQDRNLAFAGAAPVCFVSFPSLRDARSVAHTAEILAPVDHDAFGAWTDQPWRRRGDQYEAFKRRIAEGLVATLDERLPGFAGLVSYAELATPATLQHFTAHPGGAIYGQAVTVDRLDRGWLGIRTPVRALWLTGADAASPGVVGAMMGGMMVAARILGPLGILRILSAAASRRGSGSQDSAVEEGGASALPTTDSP
jgi:phytoene dehydrogenase-like protein